MAERQLSEYVTLIRNFVEGGVSAHEFERDYLQMFKSDVARRPRQQFEILNRLFSDVDAYCADPDLRSDDDIDENQLRTSAGSALRELKALLDRR
jgi:hypothetical protein